MKTVRFFIDKKSQVFVAVLIAFTIILTLGAAILMHSRSTRSNAKLQTDVEKAYALAQSGMNIGLTYAKNNPKASSPDQLVNIGGGTVTVGVAYNTGTGDTKISATSNYKDSTQELTKIIPGTPSEATTWAKAYVLSGKERVSSVLKAQDGGFLIEAETDVNAANEDILLIKLDQNGAIQWAHTYGGSQRELSTPEYTGGFPGSNTIVEVSGKGIDDGYYVAKSSSTFSVPGGQFDFLLIKVDKSNGNIVWAKSYGVSTTAEYLHDFKDDGTGFVLAGAINNGMFVLRTNYAGTKDWAYSYDYSAKIDWVESIVPFVESGETRYLLTGWTFQPAIKGDKTSNLLALKIRGSAGNGAILAQKFFYTAGNEQMSAAIKSINPSTGNFDGFVLAAITNMPITGIIAKIDPALGISWSHLHNIATTGDFFYYDLKQDASGNYYFAGGLGLDGKPLLLKTDFNGAFQWKRQYGSGTFWAMDKTDSGFVLAGNTALLGGSGTSDVYVVSTDDSGNLPGCSVVGNDQSIGEGSGFTFSSADSALVPVDVKTTINENIVPTASITVKTYPVDLTISPVVDCCGATP